MSQIKVLSIEQSRLLDKRTIEQKYVSSESLIERAGFQIAKVIAKICREKNYSDRILLIAGKGNNGGDVFAAADCLYSFGFKPEIITVCAFNDIRNESLIFYNKVKDLNINITESLKIDHFNKLINTFAGDIIVDGILGTGFKPPISDFYKALISELNKSKYHIISIDIPSGMSDFPANNKYATDDCVKASATISIGSVKSCFLKKENMPFTGKIYPVNIGFPKIIINELKSNMDIYLENDFEETFKKRKIDSHKGTYGHTLLVGGAFGFSGAIALCAKGALHSGSGLITVLCEESSRTIIHSSINEVMTKDLNDIFSESFSADINSDKKFQAICIGPGLGTDSSKLKILDFFLKNGNQPLVLDADALNLISLNKISLKEFSRDIILTPHPGEAARLLDCKVEDIEHNRFESARLLSEKYNACIVLKGTHTLVCKNDKFIVHLTGTPAMASGGMGDVLAGIISSLIGQGYNSFDASNIGVFLHGKTAEILELKRGPFGLGAGEVAYHLPETVKNF